MEKTMLWNYGRHFFLSPVCDNVLWCIKISWRSYYSTSRWEWGSQVAGHALQTIRRCIMWLSICRYCLSALPLVLYLRMGRVLTLPDIDRRQIDGIYYKRHFCTVTRFTFRWPSIPVKIRQTYGRHTGKSKTVLYGFWLPRIPIIHFQLWEILIINYFKTENLNLCTYPIFL